MALLGLGALAVALPTHEREAAGVLSHDGGLQQVVARPTVAGAPWPSHHSHSSPFPSAPHLGSRVAAQCEVVASTLTASSHISSLNGFKFAFGGEGANALYQNGGKGVDGGKRCDLRVQSYQCRTQGGSGAAIAAVAVEYGAHSLVFSGAPDAARDPAPPRWTQTHTNGTHAHTRRSLAMTPPPGTRSPRTQATTRTSTAASCRRCGMRLIASSAAR